MVSIVECLKFRRNCIIENNEIIVFNGNTGKRKICKEYHESDWMYVVKD